MKQSTPSNPRVNKGQVYRKLVIARADLSFKDLERAHDSCKTQAVRMFYRDVISYKLDGAQRNKQVRM